MRGAGSLGRQIAQSLRGGSQLAQRMECKRLHTWTQIDRHLGQRVVQRTPGAYRLQGFGAAIEKLRQWRLGGGIAHRAAV